MLCATIVFLPIILAYTAWVYRVMRGPVTSTSLGRNHYARAFSCLLAGAGVRGGTAHGQTDEYGATIVSGACHVHDYHATILHLLGLDHERLTYYHNGIERRLTDVHGQIIRAVLAGPMASPRT